MKKTLILIGSTLLIACGNSSDNSASKGETGNACDCLKKTANEYILKGSYATDNDLAMACKEYAGELDDTKENKAKMSACLLEVRNNIESKTLFEGQFNELDFSLDTALNLYGYSKEVLNYYYTNVPTNFEVSFDDITNGIGNFSSIHEENGKINAWSIQYALNFKINNEQIKKLGAKRLSNEGLYDLTAKEVLSKDIKGSYSAIQFIERYKSGNTEYLKDMYSDLKNENYKLAQQIYKGEVILIKPTEGNDQFIFNKIKIKGTINKIEVKELKMLGSIIKIFIVDIKDPQILEINKLNAISESIEPLKVDFNIDYQTE